MKSPSNLIRLYLVFLSALALIPISFVQAADSPIPETVHLTVHYQRNASDYTDWNVYLWRDVTGSGDKEVSAAGFPFTSEDSYGKVAHIDVNGMTNFRGLGIIIRRGAWLLKDIAEDRFVKNFDSTGSAEIWLRQGDKDIYTSPPVGEVAVNPVVKEVATYDSPEFGAKYTYNGDDLGNTYSPSQTKFRVWAPTATALNLVTYASASAPAADGKVTSMTADVNGTWVATLPGDQNGTIYTYRATFKTTTNEAVDPYVRATTINGEKGVVVDLSKTNPTGWSPTKPKFSGNLTDASIYELHVRDLSMDPTSGISQVNKGKFLAFTELNTAFKGIKTGIAHIKSLGVTHIELLPIFDFASVDESAPTFNWGYDPQNYNVPEGSYSSNPANPITRIIELKSAVQSLHNQGLRVNMDVVYNHVFSVSEFSEQKLVPNYFFRIDPSGNLTNGSGCGNDVASERPMVRKFIVDSVKYWASQYHLDGFRFDLMGLMDIKTISAVRTALNAIDPTLLMIGEGWNMGTLPDDQRANQVNIAKLPGVAVFNDQIRDGIKGSVFNSSDTGYVTGKESSKADVEDGIVGNTSYAGSVSPKWIGGAPGQSVNYVESHDNLTLADKLLASTKEKNPTVIASIDRLSAAIHILAQGTPFLQAGQEFLRSKNGDSNSYKSSDAVNSLKWDSLKTNSTTVSYYRGLLALRNAHPAFRMATSSAVDANLRFMYEPKSVIAYLLNGSAVKDPWGEIVVIHNPYTTPVVAKLLSSKKWSVVVSGTSAGVKTLSTFNGDSIKVPPQSTVVLHG